MTASDPEPDPGSNPLWANLTRKPVIIGAAAIGLLVLGYAAGRSGTGGTAPPVAGNAIAGGTGTVEAQANRGPGPVLLTEVSAGSCRTLAPEGWEVTEKNNEGTAFNVQSPDRSLTAAYAGFAVNGGSASGAYGPQFTSPHNVALFVVGKLAGETVEAVGEEEAVGPYQALRFRSPGHSGYVLIYRFALPADPGGFGVILRMAIGKAGDAQSVGNAGSVMAAIQCQSSLRPPPEGLYQVEARMSDHGASRSARGSDVTMAGTYNAQLNVGWASDSAGRNYRVNLTEDYRDGPDGGGFYSPSGEKLTPGMQ